MTTPGTPPVGLTAGQVEHGTLSSYTKRHCRCDKCRPFWNEYMRWWRIEQRGRVHSCPSCTCPMPVKPTTEGTP